MNSEALAPPQLPVAYRKKGFFAAIRESAGIYLFLLPTFALLLVFTYWPVLSALIHCLFHWDGVHTEFVGLGNFVEMFTIDRAFVVSLPNMLKLTAFRLLVAMTVPFLAADHPADCAGDRAHPGLGLCV